MGVTRLAANSITAMGFQGGRVQNAEVEITVFRSNSIIHVYPMFIALHSTTGTATWTIHIVLQRKKTKEEEEAVKREKLWSVET